MNDYQNMVVIFIDLLGTKNNKEFEDKFLIHKLFHSEAKTNEERNLNHVIYDRKVYSFSDCAYFFYYYKDGIEESRKDDMKLIQVAMSNTSLSILKILNAGYLVRGGIAFGNAYFDELGFFGSAVEEAFKLEDSYADVPMVVLNPLLGEAFYKWEEANTSMEVVNLLMNSKPLLVEKDKNKYFLNLFFQVEAFTPTLHLENHSILNIDEIKKNLLHVISRDKEKYKGVQSSSKEQRATIYEKLDWFENYLKTKHNRLKKEYIEGAFSGVFKDY